MTKRKSPRRLDELRRVLDARPQFYYLNADKRAIPCADILECATRFSLDNRVVALATIGNAKISTVFLGIDHAVMDGPPLLFETMVFGGTHDGAQDRCSTWDEAKAMHERMCNLVRETTREGMNDGNT